jgi:cytochrome oxidase Cu insertion factor (SCO1/SenC/PrrC family)
MRMTLVAALLASLVVVQPRAQQAPTSATPAVPDVQKLGPHVGERVPDFTLTDQGGRSHTLTSLTGARGLMLVFFRSADW